jgi:hypothetical protein
VTSPQRDRPARPTIEWINSAGCDWPVSVKQRAVEIIKLRSEVYVATQRTTQNDMMQHSKIEEINRIAGLYQQLANEYRNLGKELVYYLSQIPD